MRKVTAIVDRDKCHPNKCGHECIKYDPLNRSGGEGFHIGPSGKSEIAEEVVTEMHKVSAKMCPFGAIRIVRLPEQLKQQPIHQYGRNQFRLFNVPTPLAGQVVGIVGVNGIGKSTAMKVLAGVLQPNLGNEREATPRELIDFFKGTETQQFFEKAAAGSMRVRYKPQQIELIQKKAQGTVRELLAKADAAGMLDAVAEQLALSAIMERDVTKLSGGEMQRAAIAATALQQADVYLFDEPTSYLDIRQRFNASAFIRSLAARSSVIAVEHDLIVLDAIADLVHILYGEEGAYGVVSGVKSAKEGVNVFLSGYLREENTRFRDHAITFERTPLIEQQRRVSLCSWKGLRKQLGDFSVAAAGGEIYRGEVVGVLGENGIGKTTFVQMLAGLLQPDAGSVSASVRVAYKPQYLDVEGDQLVVHVLQQAIQKHASLLIQPLRLEALFDKQLSQLSGGELQRVSIAKALSEDAELFLLDEPSAYLDVEQRLVLSKILKRFVLEQGATVLVVDHDLLFLDYLSNRLLVFQGTPALSGSAQGPFVMEEGMNLFLREVGITFRRDVESGRPRANKPDSLKDREQKKGGKYYYG